jgi:hypothetical protein
VAHVVENSPFCWIVGHRYQIVVPIFHNDVSRKLLFCIGSRNRGGISVLHAEFGFSARTQATPMGSFQFDVDRVPCTLLSRVAELGQVWS